MLKLPLVYDHQVTFTQTLRDGCTHRALSHFLWQVVRPIARLWSMHVAAAFPKRRPQARNARAASALLLPEFSPGTGNVATHLGRGSARAPIRHETAHGLVNQRLVHFGS